MSPMIHSQVSPEKANVLPGGTAKVTLGRMSRHVDSKANCFCIYINFMISETKKYGIIYIYIYITKLAWLYQKAKGI